MANDDQQQQGSDEAAWLGAIYEQQGKSLAKLDKLDKMAEEIEQMGQHVKRMDFILGVFFLLFLAGLVLMWIGAMLR